MLSIQCAGIVEYSWFVKQHRFQLISPTSAEMLGFLGRVQQEE